ncbi:MAG: hypothetical protein IKO91_08315 [Oscillospiraceae bacterium]|nr:hypothetical protein [Oscillospiraceae bacterium]
MDITPDFQAKPALCTAWSSQDGGMTFTLELRQDVCFSDGTPMSAWDAAYSLNRAREETSGYAGRLRCIRDVSVTGSGLTVSLTSPLPSFPLRLDIPVVKEGTAYRDLPLGSGPYVLSEEDGQALLPNPFRDKSSLPYERIELRSFAAEEVLAALTAGSLDLLVGDPGALNPSVVEGAVRRSLPTSILYYIALNPRCEALAAPERRRLVNACLDRGSLSSILGGEAALIPVNPALPEYDVTEARAWIPRDIASYCIDILTEDYDGDGTLEYFREGTPVPLSFQLLVCSENEAAMAAARSMADDLRAQGISMELRLLSESEFLRAVRNGEYEAYIASMRLTADHDLSSLYQGIGDDLLRLFAEEYRSSEGEGRFQAASSLGAYSAECSLVLPLCFLKRAIWFPQGAIENMEPSWTDPFRNLAEWNVGG